MRYLLLFFVIFNFYIFFSNQNYYSCNAYENCQTNLEIIRKLSISKLKNLKIKYNIPVSYTAKYDINILYKQLRQFLNTISYGIDLIPGEFIEVKVDFDPNSEFDQFKFSYQIIMEKFKVPIKYV